MKSLLCTAILLGSLHVYADHHKEAMKGKTFEEKKSHMLGKIDKRISHLNEMKTCVTSATTEEGMMSCHDKMRKGRHGKKGSKKD